MNEPVESEMLYVNCRDMRGQSTDHEATPVVTLDAIAVAKLVCLSEEARWRSNPGVFEPTVAPRGRKSTRRHG
jgi:hypothetical protein